MTNIKCPKCHFEFNAEKYLKNRVDDIIDFFKVSSRKQSEFFVKKNGLDKISEETLTVCPKCNNEFPFTEYRFFGFLSAEWLKIILILFIFGIILFTIGVILNDLKILNAT